MSLKLSGNNALSYIGVEPLQPPNLVYIKRDPISGAVQNADWRQFNVGTFWLNPVNQTLWILVKKDSNIPLWIQLGITAAGFLQTLTADNGVAVVPVGLNINLVGDANITTIGDNGTSSVQVTLNPNITVTSVTTGTIHVTGVTTLDGNILTNLTRGVVQSPGGGGALFASEGTNGQVLISSSAGAPAWATLTAGANITITNGANSITIAGTGGGTGVNTLTGNSGVATAVANNINVRTDHTTVPFTGAGDTLTLDFLDSTDTNLLLGSNLGAAPGAAQDNTGVGAFAVNSLTTGDRNTGIGSSSLLNVTSGSDNTATGYNSGNAIAQGSRNIALGSGAGSNWVNTNDNIAIGSVGTVVDSATIRIGTVGTHTSNFQAGIAGVVPPGALNMVTIDTATGQLGSQSIPSGSGNIITTFQNVPGPYTITLNAATQTVEVYGVCGGGGGGSGRRGVSGSAGGASGGANGSGFYYKMPVSSLGGGGATINYVVGAGGAGAPPQNADNTDGNSGGQGTQTSFGNIKPLLTDNRGRPGNSTTSGSGVSNTGLLYTGVAAPIGTSLSVGFGTNTIGRTPGISTTSILGTAGGGGSGADSGTAYLAGNGGYVKTLDNSATILAGGAGGIESGTINGGAGATSNTSNGPMLSGTGGGGGGGQSTGLVAGDGGAGGPGCGGGGGGGSLNGTNSGAGGAGGDGYIYIIEYL